MPLTTVCVTLFSTYMYMYAHTHISRVVPIILAVMDLDLLPFLFCWVELISCSVMPALSHVLSYTNLGNWLIEFVALVYIIVNSSFALQKISMSAKPQAPVQRQALIKTCHKHKESNAVTNKGDCSRNMA